jgi:hypothetical protein
MRVYIKFYKEKNMKEAPDFIIHDDTEVSEIVRSHSSLTDALLNDIIDGTETSLTMHPLQASKTYDRYENDVDILKALENNTFTPGSTVAAPVARVHSKRRLHKDSKNTTPVNIPTTSATQVNFDHLLTSPISERKIELLGLDANSIYNIRISGQFVHIKNNKAMNLVTYHDVTIPLQDFTNRHPEVALYEYVTAKSSPDTAVYNATLEKFTGLIIKN